jgi:ribose-phosphate pyrophosphokinase
VLSGPALERLNKSPIKEVVVSNTIPFDRHDQCEKIKVLDMSSLLADAIERIHLEKTVSALFL